MRSGHVALATGGLGLRLLLTQFRIELPATATAVAFYLRLCNLSKLAYDAFCPVFRAFFKPFARIRTAFGFRFYALRKVLKDRLLQVHCPEMYNVGAS